MSAELPAMLSPGQKLSGEDEAARDEQGIRQALLQAELACALGEVPVGALIVDAQGVVLGLGYNRSITDHDPTAHAEIVALRQATQQVANYRLPGATLYVTLEPCVMCIGALLHARLARIVYGAVDPKTGACDSVMQIPAHPGLNHQTTWRGGVLAEACGEQLRAFFRQRRAQSREAAQMRRACVSITLPAPPTDK